MSVDKQLTPERGGVMPSINPKRSIVSLAVVAGLLAAAGPASAQGGGADFTRFELNDYCSTIAAKDSSQPEGIIAVLIGAVQPNDRPAFGSGARSFVIEKDLNQPDM
jgi:hypothetical protein